MKNNQDDPPPPPVKCIKENGKIYFRNKECNKNNQENTKYDENKNKKYKSTDEYILYEIKKILKTIILVKIKNKVQIKNMTNEQIIENIEKLQYDDLEEILENLELTYRSTYNNSLKNTNNYKKIENLIQIYKKNQTNKNSLKQLEKNKNSPPLKKKKNST